MSAIDAMMEIGREIDKLRRMVFVELPSGTKLTDWPPHCAQIIATARTMQAELEIVISECTIREIVEAEEHAPPNAILLSRILSAAATAMAKP